MTTAAPMLHRPLLHRPLMFRTVRLPVVKCLLLRVVGWLVDRFLAVSAATAAAAAVLAMHVAVMTAAAAAASVGEKIPLGPLAAEERLPWRSQVVTTLVADCDRADRRTGGSGSG